MLSTLSMLLRYFCLLSSSSFCSFSFFSSLFPLPPSSGFRLLPLPSCMDVPPSVFFHFEHLLILPDWLSQQPSTALSASLSLLQQKLSLQGCNVTNHPKTMASNNRHALLLMCLWGGWPVVLVVAGFGWCVLRL